MSTPIVFLHGWAMRGAIFDGLKTRLADAFTCHAPDLPGHGSLAGDPGGIDACVEVVAEQVQQLDRPLLVGWSMGATVAWRYLAQQGCDQIRGLVTIDMSPRVLPEAGWDLGLNASSGQTILDTSARIIPHWPQMVQGIVKNLFALTSTPSPSRAELEQMLLRLDPAHLVPTWDDLVAADLRDTLPGITVPYLICAGAESRLYHPDVSRWIATQAPDAQIASIPQTGHSPHLEAPDAFCDALCAFVQAKRLANSEISQDCPP